MCPRLAHAPQRRIQGFSLVLVLFLIVVASLLIATLTRLNAGGQAALAQETLSTRALFAAESGAQAMAMTIFPLGTPQGLAACPAVQQRAYAVAGLKGCRSSVSCALTSGGGQSVYTLISEGECSSAGCTAASCTAGPEAAFRSLRVQLRGAPAL